MSQGDDEEDEEEPDVLEKDWTGLCYTAALRWATEAEEEWFVVHGTVLSERIGGRIEHAWCEREGLWLILLYRSADRCQRDVLPGRKARSDQDIFCGGGP